MRAVYYCRVSTDEENQLNALERQMQEAKNCILSMGWELIDGYIDEGKSGTSTKKRNEYRRLFEDLGSNKFDIIVIKSQDRLMRNTKEWYIFIDSLVINKKRLFFYLENKFYTPDDALLTGIKAILAEEYSRDLSKKIRNAHKIRQEKGSSVIITNSTWGYDKLGRDIVINESEAEVVRLIYDLALQGYGSRRISKILSEREIFGRSGGHFPEITIRRIVRNPLFKGTVVMNKRTTDFDTKKIIRNPEEQWIIHENIIPAIVTSEVWEQANRVMDARSQMTKTSDFKAQSVGRNLGKYELSSKIICGFCGAVYWRKYRRAAKSDEITVDWSCSEYIRRGRVKWAGADKSGCDNIHINEADLMNILSEAASRILADKRQALIEQTMSLLEDVLGRVNIEFEKEENEKSRKKIIRQKDLLMDKLLEGTITDSDYKRKISELDRKLVSIATKTKTIELKSSESAGERLKNIKAFLNTADIGKVQTSKLIKHIDKINVVPGEIEIYFDFKTSACNISQNLLYSVKWDGMESKNKRSI